MRILKRLRRKYLTAMLGGNMLRDITNICSLTALFIQTRILPLSKKSWPIFVHSADRTVRLWVGPGSDATVLREIFVDQCYDVPYKGSPRVIIDIGANVGFSSIWYALKFPQARIWAYEPDPSNYSRLKKNTRSFPNIITCSEAVVGQRGVMKLFISRGRGMSSSVRSREGFHAIEVDGITLGDAVAKAGGRTDIIKFDIEGAEYEMLRGHVENLRVTNYVGEVHPDLMGISGTQFEEVFEGYVVEHHHIMGSRYIIFARSADLSR